MKGNDMKNDSNFEQELQKRTAQEYRAGSLDALEDAAQAVWQNVRNEQLAEEVLSVLERVRQNYL
jgi:hypothetical protein